VKHGELPETWRAKTNKGANGFPHQKQRACILSDCSERLNIFNLEKIATTVWPSFSIQSKQRFGLSIMFFEIS
jgi:hypothetical protein